mmetsp:Transcript_3417/g.5653  ORF Transcript_3417/g.5653 Transcript_3417/m.5653 type:complete len:171 (+) Transcript_3417:130-642(+)|eukprot:CAMPEP_0119012500 /NCGR_PEP_ID=MMETSP1176-20130426/6822_1 /TAXON_ID=265551 /ORGANISM="Synedropsis recta cf, Strain CCMP1620" /LENGTH=170 /DNA_ID=CAMNT_0006965475 /DNA_START=100 /DNA_END=612 /DNA_ORIENTATION=+
MDIEETSPKQPVKPALKKHPIHGDGYSGDHHDHNRKKKELVWDEPTIEEHDKLRGTRMKIDEPNTPYAYDSGAESDGSHPRSPSQPQRPTIDFDLLQDKLTDVANYYPSSPSSHASADTDGTGGGMSDEQKRKFKEHRKKHYNEMELVRQFRQEHHGDDDDDDNDADVEE